MYEEAVSPKGDQQTTDNALTLRPLNLNSLSYNRSYAAVHGETCRGVHCMSWRTFWAVIATNVLFQQHLTNEMLLETG